VAPYFLKKLRVVLFTIAF